MAGALTISTLNDSSGVLATQNGMTGIAKAWVNFNGANGAIRSSFNVSSITVASTGVFNVNFTTTLTDANYVGVGNSSTIGTPNAYQQYITTGSVTGTYGAHTTSVLTINAYQQSSNAVSSPEMVQIAVFGS